MLRNVSCIHAQDDDLTTFVLLSLHIPRDTSQSPPVSFFDVTKIVFEMRFDTREVDQTVRYL